ncbi:MAG: hypothetical protein ACRDJE_18230 [Dehalococcoidia bacterium]
MHTIAACRRAGRAMRALAPESLVLLLPGEGDRPALLLPTDGVLRRSFEEFDAPALSRAEPADGPLIETLGGQHNSAGLTTRGSRRHRPARRRRCTSFHHRLGRRLRRSRSPRATPAGRSKSGRGWRRWHDT